MGNNLFFIAIFVFVLAVVIMFLIPERWFPKKQYSDDMNTLESAKSKKNLGYYRFVFIIGGLITLAIMFFVKYVIL
jgi:hypothetical protein